MGPSRNDFEKSTNSSTSITLASPSPSQSGHMPAGSLNENALAWPIDGRTPRA